MSKYLKLIIQWLYLVGLIAAILTIWLGFILPLQNKVVDLRQAAADIDQKKLKLIDHRTSLDLLTKQESKIHDLEKRAKALIPEQSNVVDFILQLEEMVKSLGLSPSDLSVTEDQPEKNAPTAKVETDDGATTRKKQSDSQSTPTPPTNANKQPASTTASFSVSFTGNFDNVQQFLALLETVDRFNIVQKINLTYGTDGLKAKFDGKIYNQPIPQFNPKPEDSVAKLAKNADDLLRRKHFGDPLSIPSTTSGSKDPFGKLEK